jgi:hypothetical protein
MPARKAASKVSAKKPIKKPSAKKPRRKTDKQLAEELRVSLRAQLKEMGADTDCFFYLVDDYIFYWLEERKMQKDIVKKGMTYQATASTGKIYDKENPSVKNAALYNKQKSAILKDLGISADKIVKTDDEL